MNTMFIFFGFATVTVVVAIVYGFSANTQASKGARDICCKISPKAWEIGEIMHSVSGTTTNIT